MQYKEIQENQSGFDSLRNKWVRMKEAKRNHLHQMRL